MVKKFLYFILLFYFNTVKAQNLLHNANFDNEYGVSGENEGCALPFFFNPNWGGTPTSDIRFSKESSIYKSFPFSQKVEINRISGYSYYAQDFKIIGKQKLKGSIYIYTKDINQSITFLIRSRNQSNSKIIEKKVNLERNKWQKIEIFGNTNCVIDDTSEYIYDFMIFFETKGTLYLDNADLQILYENSSEKNILKNSDFEEEYGTNGEFSGCSKYFFYNPDWMNHNGSIATFSKDSMHKKNGQFSQKVMIESIPNNSYLYYAQGVRLENNKLTKASFWIKPISSIKSKNIKIQFSIRSRENFNENLLFEEFDLIPNQWQKIEIFGKTHLFSNTSTENSDFFINFKESGTYYIDEASLIQSENDVSNQNIYNEIENYLPNLIKNQSFEGAFDNQGIANYFINNPGWDSVTHSKMEFALEKCDTYNGLQSQKIIIKSIKDYAYFFQPFQAKANRIYKISAWVKSEDGIELNLTLRNRRNDEPKISSSITKKIGKNWEKIEIIGGMGTYESKIDSNTIDDFDFFIRFYSTGTLLIDDISVVDVTDMVINQNISDITKDKYIPKSFFGLHLNKLKSYNDTNQNAHTKWPEINFGLLRLWDSGTKWSEIEKQEGNFKLDRINLYLEKRDSFDINTNILLTLGSPPKWAVANTNDTHPNSTEIYTSVANIDTWKNYIRKIGNEYKSKIKYWEIWNEVDIFFKESKNVNLIDLALTAYETLKEINPNFQILSPNFTSSESAAKFLYDFKKKYPDNIYPFDIFSFHAYPSKTPEMDIGIFYGYKNVLKNYKLNNIPIWNTEGSVNRGFNNTFPMDSNEKLGAVSRAYIIQWLYDIENFNWYFYEPYISNNENWYEQGVSLSLNEDGVKFEISPSGKAYYFTNQWLINKRMINKEIINNVWIITLVNESNDKEYIIWTTDSNTSTINKETRWNGYKIYNLKGNNVISNNSSITVTPAPIFLTKNSNSNEKLSVNNLNDIEYFKLYPNPTKDLLYIKNFLNEDFQLNLYNSLGIKVKKNIYSPQIIDLRNLPKGIYFIELLTIKTGKTIKAKIIIN